MRERPVLFVHAVAVYVLLAGAFVHVALLPIVDPVKSFARAAAAVEAASGGGPIVHAGFGQGPNLLWSLDRARIEEVEDAEGLARALGGTPRRPARGGRAGGSGPRRGWTGRSPVR